ESVDEVVAGFGVKLPVAPAGRPLTVNATWPVNPLIRSEERRVGKESTAPTVWLDGDAPSVKSADAVTTSVAVVVRVKLPLTPAFVSGSVLAGGRVLVGTESVDEAVAGFGVKLPVAPAGRPLTVKATWPVNPLI